MDKLKRFFLIFIYLFASSSYASFNKDLWSVWTVNNPLSTQHISHQEWQDFLDKYLITNEEQINLINYSRIEKKELHSLKSYIDRLTTININEYNRNEQLAYWLNLYNSLVVYVIASYYPISSIEEINISPGLFSLGPWGAKMVTINHISLSLDEIHNRIIRPIWNDPRTHYAINNGSIGAANLAKTAYNGATLDQQLNEAAFSYINSRRGMQLIDGELVVSKIFEWFLEDFGESKQFVIKHLQTYAEQPLKEQLKNIHSIDNYTYNWHLNSVAE